MPCLPLVSRTQRHRSVPRHLHSLRVHCTRLESGIPRAQLRGWVDCLVIWPTPLKLYNPEKRTNIEGEMQMGAARTHGGRRFDEEVLEHYYKAAAVAGWSPFNRG